MMNLTEDEMSRLAPQRRDELKTDEEREFYDYCDGWTRKFYDESKYVYLIHSYPFIVSPMRKDEHPLHEGLLSHPSRLLFSTHMNARANQTELRPNRPSSPPNLLISSLPFPQNECNLGRHHPRS